MLVGLVPPMVRCKCRSFLRWLLDVFHDKSKHIEIKYHYIRYMMQRGVVKLQYVATNEQIADVLTKPLARVKFEYFREKLGVLHIEVLPKGS